MKTKGTFGIFKIKSMQRCTTLVIYFVISLMLFSCGKENYDITNDQIITKDPIIEYIDNCTNESLTFKIDTANIDFDVDAILMNGDDCKLGYSNFQYNIVLKSKDFNFDTTAYVLDGFPGFAFSSNIVIDSASTLTPIYPNSSFYLNSESGKIYNYSDLKLLVTRAGKNEGEILAGLIFGKVSLISTPQMDPINFEGSFCSKIIEVCQ